MGLLLGVTLLIRVIDRIEDIASHDMENHILEHNPSVGFQ
jgi:hypothetical protein